MVVSVESSTSTGVAYKGWFVFTIAEPLELIPSTSKKINKGRASLPNILNA